MIVDFHGYELECDETVFRPTTISELTAPKIPVKGKRVLDLGCGVGPLSIYFAKHGAEYVAATDVYDKHIEYTKKNALRHGVDIDVYQSDIFENIEGKFDIICCDVSGVDRRVAEMTGWFPEGVPTADTTGSDLICEAIKYSPEYLNEGGELYICTTSWSDLQKIQLMMIFTPLMTQGEIIFSQEIPFSRRLMANLDNLDPKRGAIPTTEQYFYTKQGDSYTKDGDDYRWKFNLWRMARL
tara:strand:+ start:6196 stop:6915 length:720 start_codon:yes stop_codon:yes gene_type:complete